MLKTYRKKCFWVQRDEKLGETERFKADSGNGISGEFTRFWQMEKGIEHVGAGEMACREKLRWFN